MLSTGANAAQAENVQEVQLTPLTAYDGSLGNRVYHSLRDAILALEFRPGAILRKTVICEQLGISRSPVSEAVTRLASDGLVHVIPQAGTFVSRFSWQEICEGAFLREALELAAVEEVAKTVTEEQLALLRRNLRIQEVLVADGDIHGFYQTDTGMHELILSFTGFPKLAGLAKNSWLQVNRARRLLLPSPGRAGESLAEHRAIVEAITAQDPDRARTATRTHLRQLLRHLERLKQDHPELFQTPNPRSREGG